MGKQLLWASLLGICLGTVLVATRPAAAFAPACTAPTVSVGTAGSTTSSLCGSQTTIGNTTINQYFGVPYAQAPVGTQRFVAPVTPPPSWSGTMNATAVGPACPQGASMDTAEQSEDCLYLNIWTPASVTSQSSLPVMVFIHGGAFVAGTGGSLLYDGAPSVAAAVAQTSGKNAASQGAVVVTINYRLGALGYLFLKNIVNGADIVPGNLGFLDQVAALQWVNANISKFGGNPNNVTLFGESAGAMSVGLHLFASTKSTNYFSRAIMESNPFGVNYRKAATLSPANTEGFLFINQICGVLGKGDACWGATPILTWLQGLTTQQIMAAQAIYEATYGPGAAVFTTGDANMLPFAPVVDGSIILGQPSGGYVSGVTTQKSFMFGFNQNEGQTFADMAFLALQQDLTPASYNTALGGIYGASNTTTITAFPQGGSSAPYCSSSNNVNSPPAQPYCATYQAAQTIPGYLSLPASSVAGATMALGNVINDSIFKCANLSVAGTIGTASNSVPSIYGYYFTDPPVFNLLGLPACAPAYGNVCHGNELPYVFNTQSSIYAAFNANDTALAGTMNAAWVSFALTGNPVPSGAGYTWPAYNSATASQAGQLLQFNSTLSGGTSLVPVSNTSKTGVGDLANCSTLWSSVQPVSP